MTKTCNHHFLVNQEKGEKHVFRKSKKYRTLCSVALGTMVTAVVAWGGTIAHADEVTSSVDTTIQRTENPATNLPEAQPNPVSEQTESLALTGQSNGAIAVTVPHDTVTQAVEEAKAEGVSTVEDSPMDLGNTTSAAETNQQISKAEEYAQNQVEAINEVTETYKTDKVAYEDEKVRIEQENRELTQAYEGVNQTGKETNAWVDTKVNDLKTRYADADVTVNEQVVSAGNGTSVLDYTNYGKAVETIQTTNEQAVADYLTKKTKADDIVAKNQAIQKENEAGLAKAKADNEAIERRNQAVTTLEDQKVSGITVKTYASLNEAPKDLQDKLARAKITPTGAFQVFLPDDNQVFYDQYVQTGTSLALLTKMTVKDSLYGPTKTYTNKAYQVDFGNGYETKEVTNTLVSPEPKKQNLNKDKVDINGKPMLVGTQNHYTLSWDLDQYRGIKADNSQIAQGFYFVDDYPEEALLPDETAIQFITSDGKTVSGITVKAYSQLLEAPKTLQAALSKQKIQPKGAFQVFMPEDPQDFYESYVTKGENIIIVTPMTVLETMLNSGKSYENKAYQVDFGQAYETNTVTNFVPKVTPHKSNTNQEGILIDGKTVLPNTVNYYKIVLDYSQYKDMVVTDDVLAKGFYMVDDYPEEALTLIPDGIQVLDKDGNRVSGISVSTYASLSEAPKVVQDAMAKRQFTPKGAIQVLSSDDPKTFYETYVKTGQTLVVTLPMTVKNELTKTGGQYENTAYQIDFGLAYVTETVVNNVPKLDPQKDVVIDLSHKNNSLDGKEVALNQTFNYRLVGALIPSNRATDLFEYGFEDNYDEKHDEYNGVYRSYLMTDVIHKDGSVLKEGTEVTKYTLQQVDTENGLVSISFDKSFLETISDDSDFQADVYLQMKRITTGQVENTYLHTVNGYVISSNTIVTHTPEPEEPSPNQPTPPQPPIETIELPVPASVLPNTGEQETLLGLIGAGILLGTAYGLKKKEEK
ncbi:TPA: SspB-related isopeptide-forming adhesin [Streptococcus agalactiae]